MYKTYVQNFSSFVYNVYTKDITLISFTNKDDSVYRYRCRSRCRSRYQNITFQGKIQGKIQGKSKVKSWVFLFGVHVQ